MKKIYILHQYYDPSHFKALYDCGEIYGYKIENYVVVSSFFIWKNILKKEVFHKKTGISFKEGIELLKNQKSIKKINDEILIVGLAPYDSLLLKYKNVIKKNKSIYFSSWQVWDGSDFPRGNIKIKDKWEEVLRNNFLGAACVSKTTENGLREFIHCTQVVNHALPIDEYDKKQKYKMDNTILFFGRFENAKNIEFILRWIKENKKIDFKIDFAGFGSYQNTIEELALKDNRVTCLGMLDKSELKRIICKYSYVLLPSKIEPFGISLIEALAAGTPCITSNASGPSEIITDSYNGIICDKDDYSSFCEAMNRALSISDYEYKVLCENALESGVNYSSVLVARKWATLFDSIEKNSNQKEV